MDLKDTQTTKIDEYSLKETFISILTKDRKDNTYKFAFARALIEYCKMNPPTYGIPYSYFADKFLEYYWHQECRYKIKQDFTIKSMPKVIYAIRHVFKDNSYGSFSKVDYSKKQMCSNIILKDVFGHAKSKISLVIPRFQNITEGRISTLKKRFYDYNDDAKIVRLKPDAFEFLKSNHKILSMAVLSEWAKFLERINKSLPMLVAKIEQDEIHRKPLIQYRNTYLKYTCHCFYCRDKLENNHIHVDHSLPWSYIFEDQPWNLVLACSSCNLKKSASLPQDDFRVEIIKRNHKYREHIQELDHSLKIIDTRLGWEKEIENHYTTCKEYIFGIVRLP